MKFTDALSKGPLLFDGALCTEFAVRGFLPAGRSPEELTLTKPADVMDVHAAFLEAGANILTINTFGINAPALLQGKFSARREELLQASVVLAQEAVREYGKDAYVSLVIGSTGEFLSPSPTLTLEEIYDLFFREAELGAAAGADLILISTMPCLAEARLAILAARAACTLPIAVSFAVDEEGCTLSGEPAEVLGFAASRLSSAMVGISSFNGPREGFDAFLRLQAKSSAPVFACPTAGVPERIEDTIRYPYDPETMQDAMRPYLRAGVSAIGGGEGVSPAHIQKLRELIGEAGTCPSSSREQEPSICSARMILPLSAAFHAKPITLPDVPHEAAAVAISKAQPGKVLNLNLKGKSRAFILSLLDRSIPQLKDTPLSFTVSRREEAEAALRRYPGIAAVFCEGDAYQVARCAGKYAAELIE